MWTWRPGEETAGFWLRKMLHDGLVHRFDAELTGGRLGQVAPYVAADGVSDLLASIATLSPPTVPIPSSATSSAPARRCICGRPIRTWPPGNGSWNSPAGVLAVGYASADVIVRAPARELLLVLNRRLDPTHPGVDITGDHALFTYWLEHGRF